MVEEEEQEVSKSSINQPPEASSSASRRFSDGISSARLSTVISPSACSRLRLRDTSSRTVPICAASSLLFMRQGQSDRVSVSLAFRLAQPHQQRDKPVADRRERELFDDADQPAQASANYT